MKKNMGNVDRIVRVLLALLVIILYYTQVINGTIAIIGLILSGIFILTSFISFCPLYLPFGISTRKRNNLTIWLPK
ncbi:MAG: YgaP family membrane protein [Bacteroidia bacterium]